jgi:hypothetical protein
LEATDADRSTRTAVHRRGKWARSPRAILGAVIAETSRSPRVARSLTPPPVKRVAARHEGPVS